MSYLGRISYAWYLWHWPCLVAARLWNAPAATGDGVGVLATPRGGGRTAVAIVVSFLLAAASYRFVEQPLRYAVPLARSRGLSLVMGAVLLVVVTVVPGLLLRPPAAGAMCPARDLPSSQSPPGSACRWVSPGS